jgi:hypothetical protein
MKKILLTYTLLIITGAASSQAPDSWTQKADFGGTGRNSAVGFSIGSKGYLGTGWIGNGFMKDFWEYDPELNTWTQKADFGGDARYHAVGFSIGSKGYLGTGGNNFSLLKDFWEYDPELNTWTQKADFGGLPCREAVGFSIGSKGYLGTGSSDSGDTKDFWEYDPQLNIWTEKRGFRGGARRSAVGFSIGNKGYLGTGYIQYSGNQKDFWEYDPELNTWTKRADFGGTARDEAVGFRIDSKGYLGTGSDAFSKTKDFWAYDPGLNMWTQKADFGGDARFLAVGFSIGSKGYLGTGVAFSNTKDFWEYTADLAACIATISPSGNITACNGENVTLTATAGDDFVYAWYFNGNLINGVTTNSLSSSTLGGSVQVVISSPFGCVDTSEITFVQRLPAPNAKIIPQGSLNICATGFVKLKANPGTGYTYQWLKNNQPVNGATNQLYTATTVGNYKVAVTSSNGCSKTSGKVTVFTSCKEMNESFASSSVIAYPNPFQDVIYLDLSKLNWNEDPLEIRIADVSGKIIFQKTFSSQTEIEIGNELPVGFYLVEVKGNVHHQVIPIIKQ